MSGDARCLITVCRDCCCGSEREHPDVDHEGHLAALHGARDGRVRVSQCLSMCEIANVVIVNPSPAGRAAGGRPTWLGGVLTDDALEDIVSFVEAGGPGLVPVPASLDEHQARVRRLAELAVR